MEVYQHRDAPDILPLIDPDGTGPLEIDGLDGIGWASAWIRDRQRRLWILSSDHRTAINPWSVRPISDL